MNKAERSMEKNLKNPKMKTHDGIHLLIRVRCFQESLLVPSRLGEADFCPISCRIHKSPFAVGQ